MNPQERQDLVRKYFIPNPPTPVRVYIKLAAGLLALIFGGAAGNSLLVVLAVAILGWGGYGLFGYLREMQRATPKATDKQMDGWRDDALKPIVQAGTKRLSVHPTELSSSGEDSWRLVFVGIPNPGELPYRRARGKDGNWRFSAYKIMVVYLSNWRMPVYECILDMETGVTITDATREYHLNQVDGIETISDRVTVFQQSTSTPASTQSTTSALGHVTRVQLVNLIVSGRIAISLVIGIAEGEAIHLEGVSRSEVDGSIAILREHLRERHHGAHPENLGLTDNLPGQLNMPPNAELEMPPEAPRRSGPMGSSGNN